MQAGASDRSPRFGSFDCRAKSSHGLWGDVEPPGSRLHPRGSALYAVLSSRLPFRLHLRQIYVRADWTTVGLVGSRTKV